MFNKIKKIAIVLRMSGAAGRDILSGIFLFTRQHPTWHIRIFQMPEELTPEIFRSLVEQDYNGIIASEPGPDDTAELMRSSSIPISFIGDPGPILSGRKHSIVFTHSDDIEIGRQGARYLASLGQHLTYGFVPTTIALPWSDARLNGFRDFLASHGLPPVSLFASTASSGSQRDMEALKEWLTGLPKPAAIMAAWDARAIQVLQACSEADIAVPQQVAIIGVDNDILLDESFAPALSSIPPDHEKLGFVAARELSHLMQNPHISAKVVYRAVPKPIVERESAIASAPAAHLVSRANDFIRRHATENISVTDVAEFLGVSRRLADLRFKQFNDVSINETIIRTRLETVKRLLATTPRSIHNISLACGYADPTYLKRLFRQRFGQTMREWRNSSNVTSNP